MPRSYSNWNSRRRPEPRLFQTFGSPSETSPLAELAARGPLAAGFGDDEMLPSASSPNDASLDLEDLVAGIAEGDAEFFASDVLGGGVGVGLNAATASSPLTLAALQQQQAQQHQFAQLQQLQQLQQQRLAQQQQQAQAQQLHAQAAAQSFASLPLARRDSCVSEIAPSECSEAPSLNAAGMNIDEDGGGASAAADGSGPPVEGLHWQECTTLLSVDSYGNPVAAPASPTPWRITAELTPNLLYWNERRCWMWHKKWCLPRIHVRVERTDGLPLSATDKLSVIVSAGTTRQGEGMGDAPGLYDQGLGGDCQRVVVDGTATFSSLFFQHTSYNCGKRPFHLALTLLWQVPNVVSDGGAAAAAAAAAGQPPPPGAMLAAATVLSDEIYVDARKRTHAERPDAAEDDVRLAQRARNECGVGHGGRPMQAAPAAPVASPCDALLLGGLFDATGDALLELLPDLTVCRSFTTNAYGYPATFLVGESILRVLPLDDRPTLEQTAQTLLAMALSGGGAAGPAPGRFAVRVRHPVLFCAKEPGGAHRVIAVDSLLTALTPSATPSEQRLILSSRCAMPTAVGGPAVTAPMTVLPAQLQHVTQIAVHR